MAKIPLSPGDEVSVVVTTVAPVGVLVRTGDGLNGLVRGENAAAATALRVLDVDSEQERFRAELA
ncbi:MAG TPA: hypothetical protein VFY98_06360 [Intrasporangium sp.]|nr:hypothetical protein [Intrasporangium sp.]